jgi:hydrogenase maturation protein HypF
MTKPVRPRDPSPRLRLVVRGAVQGVGFRPFVYRLATELALAGWVGNDNRGVTIEVEGSPAALDEFLRRLPLERPAASVITDLERTSVEPTGETKFTIRQSTGGGAKVAEMLPDLATCPACLAEVLDARDRRHRYPFTNCTDCGPRFSILLGLPYDRPRTTMAGFTMCESCRDEYACPADRRFHAQPNACPDCGPGLTLWDGRGQAEGTGDAALRAAAAALARGEIVAVKGLGGFHLMVDARDGEAVARLRERKARREKPLAVMVEGLPQASLLGLVSEDEATALTSMEAPIVLLSRRPGAGIAAEVAPENPRLGVMLASNPLHHLLLKETGFPLVATSGNLSEEPICTDEREAVARLGGIADRFLVHDRPIARHVDDSVAAVLGGRLRLVRRARGFAPRPIALAADGPTVLAVGAQLKNAVALALGGRAVVSQHIGDMETLEAQAAFESVIADLVAMHDARPAAIAHDLHPDYASTRWAQRSGLPLIAVQHHHAHLASCLADNASDGHALGVIWDGTGYGPDGTVWGGEFLLGDAASFARVAHFRPFRLPGGEAAVREPRRAAVGLLVAAFGDDALSWDDLAPVAAFSPRERAVISGALSGGTNSPRTTSAGRLFDGIAALAGKGERSAFEGQAAMALEFAVDPSVRDAYPFARSGAAGPMVLDWGPMLSAVVDDVRLRVPPRTIAARFHNALVAAIVDVAAQVGCGTVALSGGCFQNRVLTEGASAALTASGFTVLLHRQVPPNDGGIALGQLAVAAARLAGLH